MSAHPLDPLFASDLPGLVALRQHLHAHPELSWQEQVTQHVLREQLAGLGLAPRAVAGTGLVVDTRPGAPVCVALRADTDALPIQEETGRPYASLIPGCMHACGHDGHMAILVGVARALCRADAPMNVRLIFQPAEEGGLGAERVVRDGALEGVAEIYGLHNWPGLATGTATVAPGPVMAASRLFEASFVGVGGHGSQPQVTADPILAAAEFVVGAQSVVSRMVHPLEPAVVSFGSVEGGTKGNIIPDRVRLLGTLRALDDALVARMEDRLVRIAEGSAAPLGVRASVSFHAPYPATVNHPGPSARVAAAIADAATPWTGPSPFPCMGAEDFALYLQRVPGAYFFLGSGGPDGAAPGVHRADYDFDDAAIPFGIRVFLRLVEAAAGRGLVAPASPREVS